MAVAPAGPAVSRFRIRAVSLGLSAGIGLLVLSSARPASADPNALWNIVHGRCVPNELQHGAPAPCAVVNLRNGEQKGYVLLKDLVGATQFLLIPTARITGIESPALLAADAPNYFALAWRARTLVEGALHRPLPRDDIALAVNSASGRSQNQLHIHIDCVRVDVHDALRRNDAAIGAGWRPLPTLLAGHRYLAMRVEGDQLDPASPFKLLAGGVAGARSGMGRHTLVVVGARFSNGHPGFVILDDRADPVLADRGSGEELQDHNCTIARR